MIDAFPDHPIFGPISTTKAQEIAAESKLVTTSMSFVHSVFLTGVANVSPSAAVCRWPIWYRRKITLKSVHRSVKPSAVG